LVEACNHLFWTTLYQANNYSHSKKKLAKTNLSLTLTQNSKKTYHLLSTNFPKTSNSSPTPPSFIPSSRTRNSIDHQLCPLLGENSLIMKGLDRGKFWNLFAFTQLECFFLCEKGKLCRVESERNDKQQKTFPA
jgi:hypothetical protein